MNLKLEFEFSKADIFNEVDALKKQIDDMRPLPADVEGRVMQKLRLDWNYNSNAIEGNKLSYGETVALLQHGITAKGKPLKDHLDIQGHNAGIDFLLAMIRDERSITETDIRSLHEIILVEPYQTNAETTDGLYTSKLIKLGQYKTSPNHVKTVTGDIHYYSSPEETPAKMEELMRWYNEVRRNEEINSTVIAALFHHKFVAIHPFDDGNGRLARILMNLILIGNGYPPVVIKRDDKENYYSLLSQADVGDSWPFVEYIIERLQSSLEIYLKAINGEDIEEDNDIDKEISLFKLELQNQVSLKEKKSIVSLKRIIENDLFTLFKKIVSKADEFNDFFFSTIKFLSLKYELKNKELKDFNHVFFDKAQDFKIESDFKSVKDLKFYCNFNEFKNAKVFDVKILWAVNFEEYRIVLEDSNKKIILSKFYHETITKYEQQKITKIFIDELKLKIKKGIE